MADDDNLRPSLDRETLATLMTALTYAIAALERLPRGSAAAMAELPPLKTVLERWVQNEEARESLVKNAREILASHLEELNGTNV